ncbi:MAG: hypothetical protein LC733_07250, partial [Actinobacteria bacterium]|nr:hypothetical protein [Actinomycetota bacterium]
MEESAGQWQPWFSTAVTSSAEQAHTGSHSLKVGITASHGWGVVLRNWPGFLQSAGNKAISFWAMASPGTTAGATMSVHWRTAAGVDLRVDRLVISGLSTSWQQASAVVAAPPGTAAVSLDVTSAGGAPGNTVYLDDVVVADSAVGPAPTGPPSVLDPDTSGLEGSVGQWLPWFSTAGGVLAGAGSQRQPQPAGRRERPVRMGRHP